LCEKLKSYLALLERNGVIEFWYDRKIDPGEDWSKCIAKELEEADIILFLVSNDFINSEYIDEVEVKRALERHENDEAAAIPIILKYCDFESSRLYHLNGLPNKLRPVTDDEWGSEDKAFYDVVNGLKKVIRKIRRQKIEKSIDGQIKYLSNDLKYFLNREEQYAAFGKQFTRDKSKIQFYLIHGEKNQSPEGLYKRICHEENKYCNSLRYFEPIIFVPVKDKVAAKINFLRNFFGAFGLYLNDFQEDKWNIISLLNAHSIKNYRYIIIGITLDALDWKPYIPNLIEDWFIGDFCGKELKKNDPSFIFFFQLIYSSGDSEDVYLKRRENGINEIEDSLKKIQKIVWLPKLDMVDKSHLEKWFRKEMSDCEDKEEYLKKYFGSGDKFTMKEVERNLAKVIREYNEKLIEGEF
jgi:hypothetical protein